MTSEITTLKTEVIFVKSELEHDLDMVKQAQADEEALLKDNKAKF